VAELVLQLMGPGVGAVVSFYMAHQVVFNLLIALYGVVLIAAHRNLRYIESYLKEQYGGDDWTETLVRFSDDPDTERISMIRGSVRFPFVASPYFFSLYRIERPQLLLVIGKKHAVPRGRLEEMIQKTTEGETQ